MLAFRILNLFNSCVPTRFREFISQENLSAPWNIKLIPDENVENNLVKFTQSIMSLPKEVDKVVVSKPGTVNPGNGEVKPAEKSRQCPICHVYYKYGNSYWQHVRYVHASFLSQCVICEKSYKRTTMAKHHILHSHKIAWHLCSNYVRKIKKSDLSKSQEVKSESESKNNNLKFFKKKTLHLISSFNCYNCSGSFPTINELFQHVKCHRDCKGQYMSSDGSGTDEDAETFGDTEDVTANNPSNGAPALDKIFKMDERDNTASVIG